MSCEMNADIPMPMQLLALNLTLNAIVGTLPESWSNFTSVSTWHAIIG